MGRISTHAGWKQIGPRCSRPGRWCRPDRPAAPRSDSWAASPPRRPSIALVDRHGPMEKLRAVCRSMLGDRRRRPTTPFQATFLVLARPQAGSIRRRERPCGELALYGVACRGGGMNWQCGRTRAGAGCWSRYLVERARIESTGTERPSEPIPELAGGRSELAAPSTLPGRPSVLCYLEGRVLRTSRPLQDPELSGCGRSRPASSAARRSSARGWSGPRAAAGRRTGGDGRRVRPGVRRPSWPHRLPSARSSELHGQGVGAVRPRSLADGLSTSAAGLGAGRHPVPPLETDAVRRARRAGLRALAGPGPRRLRPRGGRPEGRQVGADDRRADPRRPGPAHPRRRGLDAGRIRR